MASLFWYDPHTNLHGSALCRMAPYGCAKRHIWSERLPNVVGEGKRRGLGNCALVVSGKVLSPSTETRTYLLGGTSSVDHYPRWLLHVLAFQMVYTPSAKLGEGAIVGALIVYVDDLLVSAPLEVNKAYSWHHSGPFGQLPIPSIWEPEMAW